MNKISKTHGYWYMSKMASFSTLFSPVFSSCSMMLKSGDNSYSPPNGMAVISFRKPSGGLPMKISKFHLCPDTG